MAGLLGVSILSIFALSHAFNIQPKIIDGDFSNSDDFPFYVFLVGVNKCGASLLSERYLCGLGLHPLFFMLFS